ncbi:MAG: Hsp20/alpha crystallin family protein [Deltaproteobacteria bacterium]|nr:Hsp20/alpha crystallin family protein [Deltaproteobacteria bacterium]
MIFRRLNYPIYNLRSTFEDLERMRNDVARLFDQATGRSLRATTAGVFPLVNLTEDKDNYFVRAELPGLKAEELNIAVTGNNLSISGERKIPSEGDNVRYHRREREAGSFNRIVALPRDVEVDNVEAGLVDGVLTVIIPKAEEAKPKQIMVK